MTVARVASAAAVVGLALGTAALAAYATLWVTPQALGMSTPNAYARFEDGSLFGIQLYTVIWILWCSGCIVFVLINLARSNAHATSTGRLMSNLAGALIATYGFVASSSWLLQTEVTLAMQHVRDWSRWEGDPGAWSVPVFYSGLVALAVSIPWAVVWGLRLASERKARKESDPEFANWV